MRETINHTHETNVLYTVAINAYSVVIYADVLNVTINVQS